MESDWKIKDGLPTPEFLFIMEKCWALVSPQRRGAHWRDEVEAVISFDDLQRVQCYVPVWDRCHVATQEDLVDAVVYYTATDATITELKNARFYVVTAPGGRRGPPRDY